MLKNFLIALSNKRYKPIGVVREGRPPPPIKICLTTKMLSTGTEEKTQQPLLWLGWLDCLVVVAT